MLDKKTAKLINEQVTLEFYSAYLYLDFANFYTCLLYTSPSPRDRQKSRMPSSA